MFRKVLSITMRIYAQSVDTGSFSNQRFKNKKEKSNE
nr:MAG TPA_asm: hypothetical protein [Caudoviricetes sp.]